MTSGERRFGDRRSAQRFEVVGQLWATLATIDGLEVLNLSRGGALVEARRSLPVGSVHHVDLECGGRKARVVVRVGHVTEHPASGKSGLEVVYLVGMEFVSAEPGTLDEIERIVDTGWP